MAFVIKEITDLVTLQDVGTLRAEVWRQEQPVEIYEFGNSDCWLDEHDKSAFHWAVYCGAELVASARLSIHDRLEDAPYGHIYESFNLQVQGKIASINRLVVKRAYRGQGLSKILDKLRLERATALGATVVLAMPLGESRKRSLLDVGYEVLVPEITPMQYGMKIRNAKLSVLFAPLTQPVAPIKAAFKGQSTTLRSFDLLK